MSKTKAIVFTKNNTRIIFGDKESLKLMPHVVVEPDLSEVQGIAPQYWKIVEDQIVPMTAEEKKDRDAEHEMFGVDNFVPPIPPKKRTRKERPYFYRHVLMVFWSGVLVGVGSSVLTYLYNK